MEIKLFSDMISALGKVTSGLKKAANLPKAERKQYRELMSENYRLIDTTLNMLVFRLGDILQPDKRSKFIEEVKRLDNFQDWLKAEREFRLCSSLRSALSEMEHFSGALKAVISVRDVDALIKHIAKRHQRAIQSNGARSLAG